MTINVHSVRVGFATNSSSSHSIIFLPGGAPDYCADGDFGWDYFTVGSQEEKRRYLAITVHRGMLQFTTPEIAGLVTREWLGNGGLGPLVDLGGDEAGYIDHQSVLTLPSNWEENALHGGFVKELRDFVLQSEIVILGGNDNDNDNHPLLAEGTLACTELLTGYSSEGTVARWDSKHNYWTLFNRNTGRKVRMSLDHNGKDHEVARSSVPELVDIKITDYCPFGCEYCYQTSTPEGKHGDHYTIDRVMNALSDLNVFEVAIGGGEPTLHPNFLEILEYARSCNVVPNFTTKNVAWLKKQEFRERALKACGAFAYSASSLTEASAFLKLAKDYDMPSHKYNIQLVMGVVPEPEVEGIMQLCGESRVRLTLLGYKTAGRGGDYTSLQYRDWLNAALRVREKHPWGFQLGIDTVLASGFDEQLKEAGVDKRFYETEEGRFSMYIDAVNSTAGPSSFCPSDEMKEINTKNYWELEKTLPGLFQGF